MPQSNSDHYMIATGLSKSGKDTQFFSVSNNVSNLVKERVLHRNVKYSKRPLKSKTKLCTFLDFSYFSSYSSTKRNCMKTK